MSVREPVDGSLRVGDRRIRIGPRKADVERRKRHAIDDDRPLIDPLNPGVPLPFPHFERLDLKTAVNHSRPRDALLKGSTGARRLM